MYREMVSLNCAFVVFSSVCRVVALFVSWLICSDKIIGCFKIYIEAVQNISR